MVTGLMVLEKKMFEGFYHIWAWRSPLPCEPDSSSNSGKLYMKYGFNRPSVVSEKIFENGDRRQNLSNFGQRSKNKLDLLQNKNLHLVI